MSSAINLANAIICGMESQSRADYEACVAGTCELHAEHPVEPQPAQVCGEVMGLWYIVSYHPHHGNWTYGWAADAELRLRGRYPTRLGMLVSLMARLDETPEDDWLDRLDNPLDPELGDPRDTSIDWVRLGAGR